MLIRHLWQLHTVAFLHWCLISPVLLQSLLLPAFCLEIHTALLEWPVLVGNTNQMVGKLSTIDFLVLASLFFKFSVRLSVFTFGARNSSTAGYTIN